MKFTQIIGFCILGAGLYYFHGEVKDTREDMAAERRCFEDAVTKEDVDECYAFMRLNIDGK